MNRYAPCPCHSNLHYQKCCRPYHLGDIAQTASALMRSRYSAFALKLADYIISTTHPNNEQYTKDTAKWKDSILRFSRASKFQTLEIIDESEQGATATVTFRAGIILGIKDASFTERSSFEKTANRWLYLSGEVLEQR